MLNAGMTENNRLRKVFFVKLYIPYQSWNPVSRLQQVNLSDLRYRRCVNEMSIPMKANSGTSLGLWGKFLFLRFPVRVADISIALRDFFDRPGVHIIHIEIVLSRLIPVPGVRPVGYEGDLLTVR